jgi:hypothetical protein
MREDMHKVVTERPRWNERAPHKDRRRRPRGLDVDQLGDRLPRPHQELYRSARSAAPLSDRPGRAALEQGLCRIARAHQPRLDGADPHPRARRDDGGAAC